MFKALEEKWKKKTSELGKLKMDVIGLTETKRKGIGTEIVRDYVHLYRGVSKGRKRSLHFNEKKKFKTGITNWEAVNENIIS